MSELQIFIRLSLLYFLFEFILKLKIRI